MKDWIIIALFSALMALVDREEAERGGTAREKTNAAAADRKIDNTISDQLLGGALGGENYPPLLVQGLFIPHYILLKGGVAWTKLTCFNTLSTLPRIPVSLPRPSKKKEKHDVTITPNKGIVRRRSV